MVSCLRPVMIIRTVIACLKMQIPVKCIIHSSASSVLRVGPITLLQKSQRYGDPITNYMG